MFEEQTKKNNSNKTTSGQSPPTPAPKSPTPPPSEPSSPQPPPEPSAQPEPQPARVPEAEPEDIFASTTPAPPPSAEPSAQPQPETGPPQAQALPPPTPPSPEPSPTPESEPEPSEPPSSPEQAPSVQPLSPPPQPPLQPPEPAQAPPGPQPQPEAGPPSVQAEPALSSEEKKKLETPELAKKEIIESADEGKDSQKEEMYVMSEKFRRMKPKLPPKKRKKRTLLIILAVVVLLIIGGGAGFYFWAQEYYQAPESIPEFISEPVTPEEPQPQPEAGLPQAEVEELPPEAGLPQAEVEEPVLSPEQTLKNELKDEAEDTVSRVELYLLEGAIGADIQVKITGNLITEEMEQDSLFNQGDYKVIGGTYKFQPKDVVFNQTSVLKIFYHQKSVEEKWEGNLVLGYFKDDLWTPLPASLNTEDNILMTNLDLLPSDTLAVLIEKVELVPKVEEFQIAPGIPSSPDSDSDGLTDVEETIYRTEANNPDSDTDGNPDGQEILNLMDPLQTGEVKLATSGLINVYTNPTFSYSFFYPASWLARAIPETNNQEVLVITNTGEFFSATVENNPERLTPVDWYLRQSPSTDQALLYSTIVNNQQAVWNPDHLTVYISKEDRVYILSYNVGTEKQANFKTTFEMLINGFQFVVQPQGRPDGTLIKYPDQAGVYLIENGKKRAFASGEVFERIGFKWEDVIEIPYSETYVDGEEITGRLDGTLIKYPDQAGVYLIENGKKRAFASGEVFEALDYKWDDVIEISADETYSDGPIIESSVTVTPTE